MRSLTTYNLQSFLQNCAVCTHYERTNVRHIKYQVCVCVCIQVGLTLMDCWPEKKKKEKKLLEKPFEHVHLHILSSQILIENVKLTKE